MGPAAQYVEDRPGTCFSLSAIQAVFDAYGERPSRHEILYTYHRSRIKNITVNMQTHVNGVLHNHICDWEYDSDIDSICIFYRFKSIMESTPRTSRMWSEIQSTYIWLHDMQLKVQKNEEEITRLSRFLQTQPAIH
jgi:hypothetical protein